MIVKINGEKVVGVQQEQRRKVETVEQPKRRRLIDLASAAGAAASIVMTATSAGAVSPGVVVESSHPVYQHLQDFAIISFPIAGIGLLVLYVAKKKWFKTGVVVGSAFYTICFAGHGLGLLLGVIGTYFNDYLMNVLQSARSAGGM